MNLNPRQILALAAAAFLSGCGGVKPIEMQNAVAPGAPTVEVQDARAAVSPTALSTDPSGIQIFFSARSVPDVVHDAVAAALVKHGVQANTVRLTVRIGRFGIESRGFTDWVTAVWGVFVSDASGHAVCAVSVRAETKIEAGTRDRLRVFQTTLDQAADQAAAAASCVPGTGL